MSKYNISDFKIGEKVYHLSNTKLIMVVIEIHKDMNEVSCRWIDDKGQIQRLEFMPEELGKYGDRAPTITAI